MSKLTGKRFSTVAIFTLALSTSVLHARGFNAPWRPSMTRARQKTCLSSSGSDDLDSLRSLLEASWDADTMGQVPADSTIAANEAFSSILSAADKGISVFFIDLLLPSYDVTQGSNLYDEVLAVEYCIALAESFSGRSSILVRDDKTVQTVQRILDRREESRPPPRPSIAEDDEDEDTGDAKDDEVDAYSESAEEGEILTGSDQAPDVDLFRLQLMASWDNQEDEPAVLPKSNKPSKGEAPTSENPQPLSSPRPDKRYRLASLFGDAVISEGSDMMEDVVEALRANALPQEDEENMIILSAIEREEMVAVRSLAAKYSNQKKIILVNCKLNPIPKELYGAETVYSLLPLIARPSGADSQTMPKGSQPKVVVLRRYPGDWQVFVDIGQGFQLAKTAPSDMSNRRGPPIKWVQQAVQSFIQSQ